jgi:hypothetical protein
MSGCAAAAAAAAAAAGIAAVAGRQDVVLQQVYEVHWAQVGKQVLHV